MNVLIDLPPKSVEHMIKDNIIMIDVRREDEFKSTGTIKNAHKLTFFDEYGNHDTQNWMYKFQKLVTQKNQLFVLICAHANRTRMIGDFLIQTHGYTNVTHLEGGMALWIKQNREVVVH